MTGGQTDDVSRMRAFERGKWEEYFAEALAGRGQEHDPNLWWRISDVDTIDIVAALFKGRRDVRVLEAACGSGGTSHLLASSLDVASLTLLDISQNALRFGRTLEPRGLSGKVNYLAGDVFNMPLADASHDLVWSVGVIEHYSVQGIGRIIREMRRVTRAGGWVVVAIPNRWSIAVLKAWLLGSGFGRTVLGWVPGYRFDSEILYGNRAIARMVQTEVGPVRVAFAGNFLWSGAPDVLVRFTNRMWPRSPLSFLSFFLAQVPA